MLANSLSRSVLLFFSFKLTFIVWSSAQALSSWLPLALDRENLFFCSFLCTIEAPCLGRRKRFLEVARGEILNWEAPSF